VTSFILFISFLEGATYSSPVRVTHFSVSTPPPNKNPRLLRLPPFRPPLFQKPGYSSGNHLFFVFSHGSVCFFFLTSCFRFPLFRLTATLLCTRPPLCCPRNLAPFPGASRFEAPIVFFFLFPLKRFQSFFPPKKMPWLQVTPCPYPHITSPSPQPSVTLSSPGVTCPFSGLQGLAYCFFFCRVSMRGFCFFVGQKVGRFCFSSVFWNPLLSACPFWPCFLVPFTIAWARWAPPPGNVFLVGKTFLLAFFFNLRPGFPNNKDP